MGSTCTIWSQLCTMALTRLVLPTPLAPASRTFRRPMLFPSGVNGRRLGILMLGMMSWGALPLSIMADDNRSSWPSASPSSTLSGPRLPTSSAESEAVSEFLRDDTLLRTEVGPEAPSKIGVMGWDAFVPGVDRKGGVSRFETLRLSKLSLSFSRSSSISCGLGVCSSLGSLSWRGKVE